MFGTDDETSYSVSRMSCGSWRKWAMLAMLVGSHSGIKSGREDDGKRKLEGHHSFDTPPAVRFRRESSHGTELARLNAAQTQCSICFLGLKKLGSKIRVRTGSHSRADRRLVHWQCGMTQNDRSNCLLISKPTGVRCTWS